MTNSNNSKTVQISDSIAKKIAVLAIKNNKTRREMLDEILDNYLKSIGDSIIWD